MRWPAELNEPHALYIGALVMWFRYCIECSLLWSARYCGRLLFCQVCALELIVLLTVVVYCSIVRRESWCVSQRRVSTMICALLACCTPVGARSLARTRGTRNGAAAADERRVGGKRKRINGGTAVRAPRISYPKTTPTTVIDGH